jgi:formamidopyrimidine-DNA glycosylase
VLIMESCALVFTDPRMFGSVEFHLGSEPPTWWSRIAPAILSARFTPAAVAEFLRRRRRAPIKAVLLMQERFPGSATGWPTKFSGGGPSSRPPGPGSLRPAEVRTLWRECRTVCRQALDAIAGRGDRLPADLNVGIPDTWLFHHRWQRGGRCPKTESRSRTRPSADGPTCWSPARQVIEAAEDFAGETTPGEKRGRKSRP